jgi:hypothetical protein
MNILKTIEPAFEAAATPPEEASPDFSMYEGNYERRPWGGEVAIRQWGDQLVVINIPRDDLEEAMIRLEHDGDHTFTRLTDNGDRREPWVFEPGSGGNTERIYRHSSYLNRIE